jgi:hypothetical protein
MRPMQQQFSNFTLNRHFEMAKNQVIADKDFYETSKNNEDLNKVFPDANFRLSDLFNELSSPNCNTNSTYSTPLTNYQQTSSSNSSQNYNKLNSSTISSSSPKQTIFQSYPSFLSSPKQTTSQTSSNNNKNNTTTPPPPPPPHSSSSSRQILLLQAAASQVNNSSSPNLVNKFPNPFMQNQQSQSQSTSDSNAITSKFYNNFYRNSINKANV